MKRIGYDSYITAAELVNINYEPDAVANLGKSIPEAAVFNAITTIDDTSISEKFSQLKRKEICVAVEFGALLTSSRRPQTSR